MPAAILTYLGEWWARWFTRAGAEPIPTAQEIVILRPESAEPSRVSAEPDALTIEQSFLETVRIDPLTVAARRPVQADPGARARTLAALEALRQIPALQSLVEGATQIMGREEVSMDDVCGALQKDSALCMRILAIANSVAISPEQRIEDLQTAVQMLGIARVRRTAQAVFTLRESQRMAEGLDWRHLWIHALATAAIAEELDRRLRPVPSPQTYMAGLMHDVGKIVLSTAAGDEYRDILVASWNGEGRLEDIERARLGVDHRESGESFVRKNRLSDIVVAAVGHHDDPSKAETHRFEAALVSVANFISKEHGLGFSGARLDASDGELEKLPAWGVISDELGRTVDVPRLEKEIDALLATLKVDLRCVR
jgi:HD-like signal output (HDOD) protein